MKKNSTNSSVTIVPLSQLRANAWNPNEMTDREFCELVDEVRRLGRIPKPIVVRWQGDSYEIIDGEHNWRAAEEVGLVDVPCEIIEADDFEAMLQTYKRNQHGRHNFVLEGRMFRAMCDEKGIPQSELAATASISDGTVRNRLQYARAAEIRNRYASENRDREIEGLQTRQVRTYVDLPEPLGDLWLDAGGQMALFGRYRDGVRNVGRLIGRFGLVQYLGNQDFRDQFTRLADLAEWLEQHDDVPIAIDYVRPIAEMGFTPLLAWIIPTRQCGNNCEICLDLESWITILGGIAELVGEPEDLAIQAATAVYERLEELDIDPSEIFDGQIITPIETLLELPGFIREANFLTPEERVRLHHADAQAPSAITERAKQDTIKFLRAERSAAKSVDKEHRTGSDYVLGIYLGTVRNLLEAEGLTINTRSFDREQVLRSFHNALRFCPQLTHATVSRRPVPEVFCDRMSELRTPELVAMRGLLLGVPASLAMGAWLDALHAEMSEQSESPALASEDVVAAHTKKPT